MDCPISRVKTQKQAAMAALIFGIILYYVAVEYDRTNICRCNQSVRLPPLADRVWQKDDAFSAEFRTAERIVSNSVAIQFRYYHEAK